MSEESNTGLGGAIWGAILVMVGGMLFLFYIVEPLGKKIPQWRDRAYASLCINNHSDGSLRCEKKMWSGAVYAARVAGAPVAAPSGLGFDDHVIYSSDGLGRVNCSVEPTELDPSESADITSICLSRHLKLLTETINFTISDITEWERLDRHCRSLERSAYLCKVAYAPHGPIALERVQLTALEHTYDELLGFYTGGAQSWERKVRLQGVEMSMWELYRLPTNAFRSPRNPLPEQALTSENIKALLLQMRARHT